MPAVTKRGRAGHRCLLSLASNLLQRSSGEFSVIVSGTFYSHGSSSMDTITTLIYSTRHLILSPCTWCIKAVLHCIHVWWDVLYMWVKKIRGMNKIYFFIRCLVDSELQSVSCVQCVNLIYQQVKKKKVLNAVSRFSKSTDRFDFWLYDRGSTWFSILSQRSSSAIVQEIIGFTPWGLSFICVML